MIAYKGFDSKMRCTQGNGTFKYKVGQTYSENYSNDENIKTRHKGFHAVIEPLKVLDWYKDKFAKVELSDDINDDANGIICSSKITILKELSMADLVKEEIIYYLKHKTGLLKTQTYCSVKNFKITAKQNMYLLASNIGEKLIFVSDNEIKVLTVDGKKIQINKCYNKEGLNQ